MQRRDFLKALGLSSVALQIPQFAFATNNSAQGLPKYFVLMRMQSGWDITLSLDPKQHANGSTQDDMFIEYAPSEILRAGGMSFGPAMQPMLRHAGGFSVVNGIITATTDNGHTANLDYLSSGNGEGKAPYVPAEIAASSQAGSLGVVFSGQSISLDRDVMMTSTSNVESLRSSVNLADFRKMIDASLKRDDFFKAQQAMLNNAAAIAKLNDLLTASKATEESDPTIKAGKILAAAFASETAYQGQIDIFADLDSHASHEGRHLEAQKKAWEQVAFVFDTFKKTQVGSTGLSLFDRTLFMVISEFSRTPALNGAKGKDHNPLTNSAVFGGGLVKPNVTFGESHLIVKAKSKSGMSSHTALPIDLTTGVTAKTRKEAEARGSIYITPEILISTVAETLAIDRTKFRSIPGATPAITALLAT